MSLVDSSDERVPLIGEIERVIEKDGPATNDLVDRSTAFPLEPLASRRRSRYPEHPRREIERCRCGVRETHMSLAQASPPLSVPRGTRERPVDRTVRSSPPFERAAMRFARQASRCESVCGSASRRSKSGATVKWRRSRRSTGGVGKAQGAHIGTHPDPGQQTAARLEHADVLRLEELAYRSAERGQGPASRPASASSSLFAVERVPDRQLAHPILEEQSDAIVLRRRALRQAMRARRLGKRPRCPMPGLHSRDILGDRGHLSVTSGEALKERVLRLPCEVNGPDSRDCVVNR